MLSGSPLPLSQDIPLHQLLTCASHPGTLGAWVRSSARTVLLYEAVLGSIRHLLIGPDLGHLLGRCDRIALRLEAQPVVLDAGAIVRSRAMQVITASPYLSGLDRLRALFPGLESSATGLMVPLSTCPPEQVMAELLASGVQIVGTSIVYARAEPLV
jgi:hypothetical protein